MALLAGAWPEAREAFEQALADGAETPEALDGLAAAARWMDDVEVSLPARERAYRLFRDRNDHELAARTAFNLALDTLTFRGDPAVATGWLQRGRDLLRDEPGSPWLGALDVIESTIALGFDKDIPRAVRLAEEAVEAGRRTGVRDLEIVAKSDLGLALVSGGRVAEGLRLLDEAAAAAVAGEMFEAASAVTVCCTLVTACLRIRDLDRAAQWYRQAGQLAETRLAAPFGYPRWEHGAVLIWWGRWDEAEAVLAREIDDAVARPAQAGLAQLALADLRRRQGRFDEAVALLDELDARPHRSGLAQLTVPTRAAVSLDGGDPAAAADLAERYLRSVPSDDPVERVDALEVLAGARIAAGQPLDAQAPSAELRQTSEQVGTAALRGLADLVEGGIASAIGEHVAARDLFERARDRYVEAGVPFDVARARLGLARALLALDRRQAAAEEAEAARLAFETLGARTELAKAVRLLVEVGPDTEARPDLRLTAREVEILRLLGQGKSNEDIAAHLVLSVRTVERHAANIYAKIGAHGRTARAMATAFAHSHGIT
jgi:ATP/maltotriose-dependent transcriptional regulator MalT